MGIRQLAEELQLSIGTVSRALNDRPDVNPETRARVKAAAARLGYVPNQSGRSLRSGRTGIVAVVIPTQGTPSADSGLFNVLEGVRRTLLRHSLDLILLFRGPDEDPLESLQRIVQRRIADAVIVSQTTADDPRLAYLNAAGIDYVAFGRSEGVPDCPFVDFDFETIYGSVVDMVQPADVRWTAELLAKITDAQWDDAFRAADYAPEIRARFIKKIKAKIAEGLAVS